MSSPFLGEIKMFAGSFAPKGYAVCDGQIIPLSQNTALYSLLGTAFGGNGTSNFGLPNLQNSVPVGAGSGPGLTPRVVGQTGGSATVTLLNSQMPMHQHALNAYSARSVTPTNNPVAGGSFGQTVDVNFFAVATPPTPAPMSPNVIGFSGGNQPHNNIMPTGTLFFIIAVAGIFPARN